MLVVLRLSHIQNVTERYSAGGEAFFDIFRLCNNLVRIFLRFLRHITSKMQFLVADIMLYLEIC
jgi:hypothetical protein